MKKILLLAISVLSIGFANAQDCNELFISEYVEGTGNNKALEIYNPTNNPISLANYRVIRWDNGSVIADQSPEGRMDLPTNITMPPHSVYVIALNLTDPNGTGQSLPIDTALQNRADTLLCPGCATGTGNPRVMCFNGDDALSLEKNNGGAWTKVDIFASIGERPSNSVGSFSPGAAWTILPPFSSIPANYDAATQGPYFLQYWTQDKTLKRKFDIKKGVTVNPAAETFNASVEWDSLPANTFSGLGKHECFCNPTSINELQSLKNTSVYPNPANNLITVTAYSFNGTIEIIDVVGKVIFSKNVSNLEGGYAINSSNFSKGIYTIKLTEVHSNKGNKTALHKIVVQ